MDKSNKTSYKRSIMVYTPLLKIERTIYSILDWRLPFPVSLRQTGFFALSFGIALIIGQLPIIGSLFNTLWLVTYIIIPVLLTYYLDKFKLDGKPPLFYFVDKLIYTFVQKGSFNRFERIERLGKSQFTGAVGFRKGEENK